VLLREFLDENVFLNADEIAREIARENPEAAAFAAGRVLIERMRGLVQQGRSFALETTCSGKTYLHLLEQCKSNGWRIALFYFWLSSPDVSMARVANRVREGGHGIPREAIFRRYRLSVWNMLHLYLPLADTAAIYDNSKRHRTLIAEKESGIPMKVIDQNRWSEVESSSI
jgi:predicted ABC-type ATPase